MAGSEEPTDSEAFATTVPLTDLLGTHPKVLVLSTMLSEESDPPTHFTVNEIVRISGLDEETVETVVDDLGSIGVIVETDDPKAPDAATYKLDEDSDAVADLRRLYVRSYEALSE